MTIGAPATGRAEWERVLLIRCGVLVAFIGLALYQLDVNRLMGFLSSAMVFTGAVMALPQLIVQALKNSRNS